MTQTRRTISEPWQLLLPHSCRGRCIAAGARHTPQKSAQATEISEILEELSEMHSARTKSRLRTRVLRAARRPAHVILVCCLLGVPGFGEIKGKSKGQPHFWGEFPFKIDTPTVYAALGKALSYFGVMFSASRAFKTGLSQTQSMTPTQKTMNICQVIHIFRG